MDFQNVQTISLLSIYFVVDQRDIIDFIGGFNMKLPFFSSEMSLNSIKKQQQIVFNSNIPVVVSRNRWVNHVYNLINLIYIYALQSNAVSVGIKCRNHLKNPWSFNIPLPL